MVNGLSTIEAQKRLLHYGRNVIEADSTNTVWSIVRDQLFTTINAILLIAAILSIFLTEPIDTFFILGVIVVNSFFGFLQEYRAQKSIEKLREYTAPTALVIRDGKQIQIPAANLVPGDVVVISEGNRIPADGRLTDASHMEIDESILTGESLAVLKKEGEGLFLGTLISRGHGFMTVESTGKETRFGKIADTLANIEEDKVPLQKSLDKLGKNLSFTAVAAGLLLIPIGIFQGVPTEALILVAASIGVAAIPEGLPAVVTMAYGLGTRRMAKKGAIVRKMASVETLGEVQVILIDKTGTITKNMMEVKKHWLTKKDHLLPLIEASVLGNTASLIEKGSGRDYEVVGDQTDGALLVWSKTLGDQISIPSGEVVDEYVFNEETKTITTVWKRGNTNHIFVRGAPEKVLERSRVTPSEKKEIEKQLEEYANQGLRVIGFGMKTEKHVTKNRESLEQNLTFLGLVAIFDPPRPEVKEAISRARGAGIHVIMVTGDNPLTARTIGREVGLIQEDEDILTGHDVEAMSHDKLSDIILRTSIIARAQPEDKLKLVEALKKDGFVVAVTGDGVNDSLALKKADVGLAMGQGGTDVAKEAADIVLTDNNFTTIVHAIEEGRTIYKNIMTAILYLLSGNLGEISVIFIATLLHLPFPLLPTQILWINLVTDSLPALALAIGSRDATVLSKKPRRSHSALLNLDHVLTILLIGLTLATLLIIIFVIVLRTSMENEARTVVFNLMIYFHLLIVIGFGWRSIQKGNMFLVFTILFIFILQLTVSNVPFFQTLLHLAP